MKNQKNKSTLSEVWQKMKEIHFPSLELSTCHGYEKKWSLLKDLNHYHMDEITALVINDWIVSRKKWYLSNDYEKLNRGGSSKCNMQNELNFLKTIFNWYKNEEGFESESQDVFLPIRSRHKAMSFIRNVPKTSDEKKIPVSDAFLFFSKLPQPYKDLAMIQYFCAGRISEIAGIQITNIYLSENYFLIKESLVWCNNSKIYEYLKPYPKNREPRRVFIHSVLKEIIKRRLGLAGPGCNYLFHINGKPLNYCNIQRYYKMAQQKAEISYSGTHCLRHGMATLARKVGGMGLDSVVAMTGHKSLKLADHYSKVESDLQKKVSLRIVKHIKELKLINTKI